MKSGLASARSGDVLGFWLGSVILRTAFMEVSHGGYVRLLSVGSKHWLSHSGTGKVVLLPADRGWQLRFDAVGHSFFQQTTLADLGVDPGVGERSSKRVAQKKLGQSLPWT